MKNQIIKKNIAEYEIRALKNKINSFITEYNKSKNSNNFMDKIEKLAIDMIKECFLQDDNKKLVYSCFYLGLYITQLDFNNKNINEVKNILKESIFYTLVAGAELFTRSNFSDIIRQIISPIYRMPKRYKKQNKNELISDMILENFPMEDQDDNNDYIDYYGKLFNGDDVHVLLYLIEKAKSCNAKKIDDKIHFEIHVNNALEYIGWSSGGNQINRFMKSIKKIAKFEYTINSNNNKKKYKEEGECLDYTKYINKLKIAIPNSIIKIYDKHYYRISLSFFKTLEFNLKNSELEKRGYREFPIFDKLTRRQKRMIKKLYVSFKVQGNKECRKEWQWFYHLTGEFYNNSNRMQINRMKKDLKASLSFLKKSGQIEFETNNKFDYYIVRKNSFLIDCEKFIMSIVAI
jgi:hypothetical protein